LLNRIVQGIVASTLIGAAVGTVMLIRQKKQRGTMGFANVPLTRQNRGAIPMVRNNARRWTSAVRSGTKALTRKLSNV
jgi:hypothetical protein